jgi:hypothetical protein
LKISMSTAFIRAHVIFLTVHVRGVSMILLIQSTQTLTRIFWLMHNRLHTPRRASHSLIGEKVNSWERVEHPWPASVNLRKYTQEGNPTAFCVIIFCLNWDSWR